MRNPSRSVRPSNCSSNIASILFFHVFYWCFVFTHRLHENNGNRIAGSVCLAALRVLSNDCEPSAGSTTPFLRLPLLARSALHADLFLLGSALDSFNFY